MSSDASESPIHELIAHRWSPYSFADKPVAETDLRALFEAARRAPSCYNEQPWHYIIATQEDAAGFEQMLSCLVEGNRAWAQAAPVLALGIAKLNFTHNGKPNKSAFHDLGLAAGNLLVEATARGLCVHQMIGIRPEVARETYGIPEGYEALTGLAVGYLGAPELLPAAMRERDRQRRPRREVREFLFSGRWGKVSDLAE